MSTRTKPVASSSQYDTSRIRIYRFIPLIHLTNNPGFLFWYLIQTIQKFIPTIQLSTYWVSTDKNEPTDNINCYNSFTSYAHLCIFMGHTNKHKIGSHVLIAVDQYLQISCTYLVSLYQPSTSSFRVFPLLTFQILTTAVFSLNWLFIMDKWKWKIDYIEVVLIHIFN